MADAKATAGFIDLDAVPDEGASAREVVAFLLSPEAKELRPLLAEQLGNALDLLLRDRLRRAWSTLPTLAPRLPFLGPLPLPKLPPVAIPGMVVMELDEFIDVLAPPLDATESIHLATITELFATLVGELPRAQSVARGAI